MQINSNERKNMREITQEDINRGIVNGVQPVVEKSAELLGRAKPAPDFVSKVFAKIFKFIWSLLCFPFLPVINMWRKS